MQFEGGATATLQMVAFTNKLCQREVKIYGTKVCIYLFILIEYLNFYW